MVGMCTYFVCTCTPRVFPESQWREKNNADSSLPAETDGVDEKHIETLSQICRTHLRYPITRQRRIYQMKSMHSSV